MTDLDAAPAPDGHATTDLGAVLQRAARYLLSLQSEEGWWKGELETNVTMDAEDLLLRHFLGILDPATATATARWIRSNQAADGTWSTFYGGPPDLSTTIEAYVALRLAGDDPAESHMTAAAAFIRASGGVAAARVFTRIWLALVGRWSWDDLPVLPPELIFLPSRIPLNIYDFACWARQTVVALTVVISSRPSRPLPFDIDELLSTPHPAPAVRPWSLAGIFHGVDRLLHTIESSPDLLGLRGRLRRRALRRVERWIVERQESDGLWGGIQPPVVYSIMALELLGYPLDHPCIRKALEGLEGFTIRDERGRRIEACQSPVWDTALAVVALKDAGVDSADPGLARAVDWLVGEEVIHRGDWAVRRPGLEPGGWAFEFANDWYPDIDDTAEVVLALRAVGAGERHPAPAVDGACRRGAAWVLGMQSRDGGWGAFDADNDSRIVASLPFCDFGEVTDPPSADVTAHVIEMLATEPHSASAATAIARGVEWLRGQQEPDGSWFGRWGVNYLYGTGAVLPALAAAGVPASDPSIRRAVRWLESHQNEDGGWGEDLRSYIDDSWHGVGTSTASQTAWAMIGLIAAGENDGAAVRRGAQWLAANQRPDGGWDEPQFTGTGFPWDFTINYHLYRLVWPVMALGRHLRGQR